ncbi:MAG: amino acid ABC transporter substrate-binding protein [Alteromonadales bacterium]|nr:amino acid ABC transporter substrate-binding protein [Alteromonadales bacterium]
MQHSNNLLVICTFILLFFLSGQATANTSKNVTIVVATDEWPPFRIATKENGFEGFDIDLLRAISQITDLEFEVKRYPWARALKQLQHHKVDMMTGLAYTPERALYINYIAFPYFVCKPAFYIQRSLGKDIFTYDDLYQYKIGSVLNSAYFEPFDSDKKIRLHAVATEAQLLNMAERGRFDIFVGTDCQVDYELTKKELWSKLLKTSYQPDQNVKLYLGLAMQEDPSLLAKLGNALIELDKSGELDKIKKQYFSPAEVQHETTK